MPEDDYYSMVPFNSQGFFWVTFTGEVSIGRLARAYDAFRSHPDYTPGVDELADFTQSSLKGMRKKEIEAIREYMVSAPEQHDCKSAIVVSTTIEYGLTRMMGLSLDVEVPVDRFVCYSVREALEWLRPGREDELMAAHETALRAAAGS